MICVVGAGGAPATLFYARAEDVSVCVIWSNGGADMRFSEQEAKIGVSLRVGIIRSYIVCYICIYAICTGKGPKIKSSENLVIL